MEPMTVNLEHHGVTVPALVYRPYIDRPEGDRPTPAIVIAAEAYGVNTFARGVAAALAGEGYVVVVPDYYRGNGLREPDDYSDFTEVMSFIDALDFTGATLDIVAAIDRARNMSEVDPDRVAVWGYCTGATLAMLASALERRLAASVLFFPSQPTFPELTPTRPVHPIDMLWAINCPLLLIYGDSDPVAPADLLAGIRDRLRRWSIDHEIRLYEGAGHTFEHAPVPPLRHDAAAAASWIDAVAFVDRVLRVEASDAQR